MTSWTLQQNKGVLLFNEFSDAQRALDCLKMAERLGSPIAGKAIAQVRPLMRDEDRDDNASRADSGQRSGSEADDAASRP